MAGDKDSPLDLELSDLPQEMRWRVWMGRVEAVIFASAKPVSRETLQKVVGQKASVDLLIEDLRTELQNRSFEIVSVENAWLMRTRTKFADTIRAATLTDRQGLGFNESEMAVLASIAYQQPISRAGLKDVFGKDISRDLITRLRLMDLITTGPRSPRPGAPHTFVTTQGFLVAFDLKSLRDLPDMELLGESGLLTKV